MSLPKEFEVETDKGCGVVYPGEKYPVSFVYRPSIENGFEEGHIACKISTGKICARELKLKFQVNITKCPFKLDKKFVEFQALPENEKGEIVFQI